MKWRKLSSEYISNHKYFTARKDKCVTPNGKVIEEYFVVELPGGFIDKNESPQKAMARELLEETGYEFSDIEQVGLIAANPGVLNNYTALFLARGGKKTSKQQLDHNEEIEVITISLEELKKLFLENKIVQSLHAICIFYALKRLGEM